MGGCRCYFRQCHVSSAKFPRMHFFRFPLKELERYKKWRQFSKMESILKFPDVRRKNTSICARHFRVECFMNYRMDRLTPRSVPTIMRLSDDRALDFELDIENGILVTLQKTTFKHLIPPDGFECPLSLTNDKILIKMLNELQSKRYCASIDLTQNIDSVDSEQSVEYEEIIMEKIEKTSDNSVEILETIQVAAPKSKRSIEGEEEERPACSSSKKCKILNIGKCAGGNATINSSTVLLASRSIHLESSEIDSDEIAFMDTDQIENTDELVNKDQLLLTSDDFTNADSDETGDIEVFEVHKDANSIHFELPLHDSDTTIVQLKPDYQVDSSANTVNQEFLKMQNRVSELKKKSQDFDTLQVRLSLLEAENNELKKTGHENEEMSRKLISLQMENSNIKTDHEDVKVKLQNYSEENKKLREEAANIDILKSELLFRKHEAEKLEKLLETLRNCNSKEQKVKEQANLEIERERSNNKSKTAKLKEELNVLKGKLELSQQQLEDKDTQLKDVKTTLNRMEIENGRISQQKEELEKSLSHIQTIFDIKQNDYRDLKSDFDNLEQKHSLLEKKYWKLQTLQNQETTVSTSVKNTNNSQNHTAAAPSISANSITKSQLFNGIKRYLSASMVSLLRMEMFGSSEREWKSDERQVAIDILGLGEIVYKYFIDEWRIRLPALRDVRNWLSESQVIDDEDL